MGLEYWSNEGLASKKYREYTEKCRISRYSGIVTIFKVQTIHTNKNPLSHRIEIQTLLERTKSLLIGW